MGVDAKVNLVEGRKLEGLMVQQKMEVQEKDQLLEG